MPIILLDPKYFLWLNYQPNAHVSPKVIQKKNIIKICYLHYFNFNLKFVGNELKLFLDLETKQKNGSFNLTQQILRKTKEKTLGKAFKNNYNEWQMQQLWCSFLSSFRLYNGNTPKRHLEPKSMVVDWFCSVSGFLCSHLLHFCI